MPLSFVNSLEMGGFGAYGIPRIGPFAHEGNLYAFFLNFVSYTEKYIECWKSEDQGQTWAAIDNDNHIRVANYANWYNCFQADPLVYVACVAFDSGYLGIVSFDTVSDTWGEVSVAAGVVPDDPSGALGVSIAARADGSVILAYNYDPPGTSARPMVCCIVRSPEGDWGLPLAVIFDSEPWGWSFKLVDAVLGVSDVFHVFAERYEDVSLAHRSVALDGELGTIQLVVAGSNRRSGNCRAYCQPSGELVIPFRHHPSEALHVASALSVADPTWSTALVTTETPYDQGFGIGISPLIFGGLLNLFWLPYEPVPSVYPERVFRNAYAEGEWGLDTFVCYGESVFPGAPGLFVWEDDVEPVGNYYLSFGPTEGSRYYALA